MTETKRVQRVAVLGAGPAGLNAAYELRQLGHQPTVFEASARVGGKVCSIDVDGVIVELGAVIVFPSWQTVQQLAKTFAVDTVRFDLKANRLGKNGEAAPSSAPRGALAWLRLLRAVARYRGLALRASGDPNDGFASLTEEFLEPFGSVVERLQLQPIREAIRRFFVGCGYGDDINTVPVGYVLRLFDWPVLYSFLEMMMGRDPPIVRFPNGYQQLWERVAAVLDVRLEHRVVSVHRVENGFEVSTHNGVRDVFDRVVIAIPMPAIKHIEGAVVAPYAALCDDIEGVSYVATAWRGRAVPAGDYPRFVTYFMGNFEGAPSGSVVMSLRFRQDADVNVAYQFAGTLTPEELAKKLEEEIVGRGGRFDGIAKQVLWPSYFPRLYPERKRVPEHYLRVATLQSPEVLFVGGAIAFESVEHSAGHARRLVHRHYDRVV